MASKAARKIAYLRKADFKHWHTTLWLVKRRLGPDKNALYSVLRVDLDKRLQTKLKNAVIARVQGVDYSLEEYDFLTADQDDRLLTVESDETDFAEIQAEVDRGTANKRAEEYEDLLNSWAYVIKVEHDDDALYAVRKINKLTRPVKLKAVDFLIFENKKLTDLDDRKVFTIDTNIDFFAYEGTVFITNKREFESAMNFRAGMERNRDSVLAEIASLKILSDIEVIRKAVGVNMHMLRKVSAIQKSGYYKDTAFVTNLIKMNAAEGWGLTVTNGVIAVDESNVDLLLTLFNNSRLKSPINQEVFDAPVKKKVT
jgi:hypothetical protein